jgi:sugar fermentation stimulation protein A
MIVDDGALLLTQRASTRAYPLELEAVHADGAWVGANPIASNAFAAACVSAGLVRGLRGAVRREVAHGRGRFDLLVDDTLVEVKTVTMRDGARAIFPDAPSERGTRHLDALARLARRGKKAAMLYVVVRGDCTRVAPADVIDPAYARAFERARRAGVLMRAIGCALDERGASYAGPLRVE